MSFHSQLVDAVLSHAEPEDTTEAPVKDSSFVKIDQAEINSMKSLIADAAKGEDAEAVANRKAIAPAEQKKITRLAVRKVTSKDFYRVWKNADFRMTGARIIDGGQKGFYLVAPNVNVPPSLSRELKSASIYTAATHTGDFFLLVVPKSETTWYDSARDMVNLATKTYIKVIANMAAGGYDHYETVSEIPEPDWTSLPSFPELLALGFRDRVITNDNHRALRLLTGDLRPDQDDEDRF